MMHANHPVESSADFEAQGYALVDQVITASERADLQRLTSALPKGPGQREVIKNEWCVALAKTLRAHHKLSHYVRADSLAVQCIYFEKSLQSNWLVASHQDLSIPVKQVVNHNNLRGWSVKDGTHYVQPPAEVLQQLVAVRVHLDPCLATDGPLWVAPGSHRADVLSDEQANAYKKHEVMCPAMAGDALVIRPLILHRSSKTLGESRRRVLHFVFGPRDLPNGLQWQFSC